VRFLASVIAITSVSVSVAQAQPMCGAGTMLCGVSHCAPVGQVCCASVGHEELSCPAGTVCKADGTCGYNCAANYAPAVATCGGDTCSCAVQCASHGDCDSGCCTTGGYCAPLCVCQGFGKLYVGCDTTSGGYPGKAAGGGCDAAPGARETHGAWLVALAALLLAATLRRRRAS
jgi:MYXO-CTERM domain-containing protein